MASQRKVAEGGERKKQCEKEGIIGESEGVSLPCRFLVTPYLQNICLQTVITKNSAAWFRGIAVLV